MSSPKAQPRSICIVRLSAIGDICHTIAVIQAIQIEWPSTKITWITGKIESELVKVLPGVHTVIFDKSTGLSGIRQLWSELENKRFDILLHMQVALRASLLTIGIKAKRKVGFSPNRSKELQSWFVNEQLPNTNKQHVLDNLAQFPIYLGVPFNHPTWNIPVPESACILAERHISEHDIIICPSASNTERNWSAESYASVINYAATKNIRSVLVGSPLEREISLGQKVESLCHSKPVNLIGKTTLLELLAVLKKGLLLIAPDTGPAHMATTQGTPVIGLYAHSNPLRTGPYNSLNYIVSTYEEIMYEQTQKVPSTIPWGKRAKGSCLMETITTNMVIEQLDKLLLELDMKYTKGEF